MYSAEKKELKALENVKVLKLEKDVLRLKKEIAEGKNSQTLENNKLKENMRSMKTLHKDQLRLKDTRISDQDSTIKSLKVKLKSVEKSEASLQAKLINFQQQSIVTLAKKEHKKELIEIREKNKKVNEEKRMRDKLNNEEMQKRKLEDAIRMHSGFMPSNTYKSVQGNIINNFRNQRKNNISSTYMWQNNTHDEVVPMMFTQPQDPREVNGISNAINLTENQDDPTVNVLEAIPNIMAMLQTFSNNNVKDTTTTCTAETTDERTSRAKKKCKLMKVCVDRTRSALKKKMKEDITEENNHVSLSNNDTSSSSDSSTCDNENSKMFDEDLDMKMPAIESKKKTSIMKQSDAVHMNVPEDSDDSGSASLL